jgi:hypothetical protein
MILMVGHPDFFAVRNRRNGSVELLALPGPVPGEAELRSGDGRDDTVGSDAANAVIQNICDQQIIALVQGKLGICANPGGYGRTAVTGEFVDPCAGHRSNYTVALDLADPAVG